MRLVLLLLLAGCAGLDPDSCRGADWYRVGFRDAMYGLQRQDFSYDSQCAAHGATVDDARYAQGWREGKYEFDRRASQSQD
jgi:uncharacterized protein DUF2799